MYCGQNQTFVVHTSADLSFFFLFFSPDTPSLAQKSSVKAYQRMFEIQLLHVLTFVEETISGG